MSTRLEGTYRNAPIEVTTTSGRRLYFEVDNDGGICVTAEIDDTTSFHAATMETYFDVDAEDWSAVVEHIAVDQLRRRG